MPGSRQPELLFAIRRGRSSAKSLAWQISKWAGVYLLAAAFIEGSDGGVQLLDGDRHGRVARLGMFVVESPRGTWQMGAGRCVEGESVVAGLSRTQVSRVLVRGFWETGRGARVERAVNVFGEKLRVE